MAGKIIKIVGGFALASAVIVCTIKDAQADPLYSVTDIGVGDFKALNDNGQIIGRRFVGVYSPSGVVYTPRGVLYSNGTQTDLGPGFLPDGINNKGQLVGVAINDSSEKQIAVREPDGTMRTLGPYIGHPHFFQANGPVDTLAINTAGQVVAASDTDTRLYSADGKSSTVLSFAEPDATNGAKLAWVAGLSDSGRVAGSGGSSKLDINALVYTGRDGLEHLYGALPNSPMGPLTGAFAVTHSGLILGNNEVISPETGIGTPIKYPAGTSDPADQAAGLGYRATGINDAGVIVGNFFKGPATVENAFVLNGNQLVNLNDVIPKASDIHISEAIAINDNGQILAVGALAGSANMYTNTYLLTPVNSVNIPEPSTVVLFAVGLLMVRYGRKKAA